MHKILINTHKESNINILKSRDYYFDKARFLNNRMRRICLLGPIITMVLGLVVVASMRQYFQHSFIAWLEQYLDVLVGCVAIIAFVLDDFLENIVESYLSKSNALRELYDVKVLGLAKNEFYYRYTEEELEKFIDCAKYVKDKDKYEAWYREIFSENDFANAICAMMDNILYTYYAYTENAKRLLYKLLLCLGIFVVYGIGYVADIEYFYVINPFILFFAFFDYVKETIESFLVSKNLAFRNKELKEYVLSKADSLLEDTEDKTICLRCLQDVIIDNREKGLFIPKSVRNKYLKNDSAYYEELDQVKNIFWGNAVEMPQYAEEFEICAVENENTWINLKSIHEELKCMLEDVKTCLDQHNISFLLDGGTLIGACRRGNNNGFLQWDDDIDIAVKSDDVDRIKEILRVELGEKYEIQDYYNEEAYSPRLAAFRIRQKNSCSMVCEKDSELYELYSKRGLFLDVYAYGHVLGFKWMDKMYRYLFIHFLNRRIRRIESNWKYGVNPEKTYSKFVRVKEKYMKRAEWYIKNAKNKKYVVYEPFYIYDLKKAGPYIKHEDMYAERKETMFEGTMYEVPSNSAAILTAFYGENWEKSPQLSWEELTENGMLVYSRDKFDSSSYKHLKRVSLYK